MHWVYVCHIQKNILLNSKDTNNIHLQNQNTSYSKLLFALQSMKLDRMANTTNGDETPSLLELFDPPLSEDPIALRITIIIIMLSLFIIAVVGNVASCIVIIKNRAMHTVTNLYLLNLSVSDLLLLSTVYLDLLYVWKPTSYPFGYSGCILHVFSFTLFRNIGILTILALTIERYFAIFYPLRSKGRAKSSVIWILCVVWIFSIVITVIDTLELDLRISTNAVICVEILSVSTRVTNAVLAILIFVIPMIVIGAVYVMIAVKLNRKDQSRDKTFNKKSSRRKATRMLAVLTVAFFVCQVPTFIMRVMIFISNYSDFKAVFGKILRGVLYLNIINSWLSTAVNPIIFSIMSEQFQTAFKALLRK